MTEQPQQPPDNAAPQQAIFNIEKLYVKDMSLEVPGAPAIFQSSEQPQIEVGIHNGASVVEQGALYEVVLTATVVAKAGERTVFLVEVAQAGLFHIRNLSPQDLDGVLGVLCPTTLLPYAREVISSAVSSAGFPPVILQHVDFNQVYMQSQQRSAEPVPSPAQVN
jgi:preprotein translocase subunit SecB